MITVVPAFWSAPRCQDAIAAAEQRGIVTAATDYPPHYRNNDRQVFDDDALAAAVFDRLVAHLPALVTDADGVRWRPSGVNPRFRICRYRAGQTFTRHRDGVHHAGPTSRSMRSLLIYLDGADAFTGGRTRFFADQTATAPTQAITPVTGTLACFPHDLWHDGEPVTGGVKYVLRSDVMFDPIDPDASRDPDPINGHAGYIWQAVSCGGDHFVTGGRDRRVIRWRLDGTTPVMLNATAVQTRSVTCLARLACGRIVAGSRDRSLALLEGDDLAARVLPHAHDATLTTLAALPGGGFVSACAGGVITVRDRDGAAVRSWRAHDHWITGLALHGDVLWSIAEDGARRAWHVDRGTLIDDLRRPGQVPSALAIGGDGTIAVGFLDGSVVATGAPIAAHAAAVRTILPLPGGAWLTGGEDGRVRRLDGDRATTVAVATDFVRHLARVGDHVLAVGYDGRITVVGPLATSSAA